MKIISRKEAMALGLKKYFTGKPCSKGHVCEKRVSNYECVECSTIRVTGVKFREKAKKYNSKPENKIKNKARMDRYLATHSKEELTTKSRDYSCGNTSYNSYKHKLTLEEDPRCYDKDILEVKCAHCRKYFKPKQMHVNKRV